VLCLRSDTTVIVGHIDRSCYLGCGVLIFCGTLTPVSRSRKISYAYSDSDPKTNNLHTWLKRRAQYQTRTASLVLTAVFTWHRSTDRVLKNELRHDTLEIHQPKPRTTRLKGVLYVWDSLIKEIPTPVQNVCFRVLPLHTPVNNLPRNPILIGLVGMLWD